MKKIFLNKLFPILILFLLLPGCKIKEYTPEIPSAFEQSAVASSGDFSYECVICSKDGASAVPVTSTFASDLLMIG
ncbi:MAG: hypothetical protein LUG95_02575, partial [Clostridiales bacterium]|nr:hypothetical protein [Clostridiales bacterium]